MATSAEQRQKLHTVMLELSINALTIDNLMLDAKNPLASAQEVANSAGLTLSTLVNAYLRQVAATRRIELYAPEQMTPKLEELIAEVEAELKGGKASEEFNDVKEFLADLKK